MKRFTLIQYLVVMIMLVVGSVAAWGSAKLNQLPLVTEIKDTTRLYVFNGPTSNRNITGLNLKGSVNTEPVLRGRYGNYSTITLILGRYSSNGAPIPPFTRYTTARITGRSYMYFVGQKLVITSTPPP